MANAVVVGSNRGIGLELVRQLVARGDTVVAACRRSSPELDRLGVRVETGVDVQDHGSVADFAGRLGDLPVHVLICNAGVLVRDTLDDVDLADVLRQLDVNAVGPLRVVRALRRGLASGAKVGLVSSRMGSLSDASGGYYGYRMSKAALNMVGVCLARDLRGDGVAVALLHPGYVRTDMTGHQGNVEPEQAARGILARLDALTLAESGGFWHADGKRLPW